MKLKFKPVGIIAAVAAVSATALLAVPSFKAYAADVTVNPGDSIQTAINNAAAGDTITINAGTYNEYLSITKPLTLKGSGTVIIKTKSTDANATKGIELRDTHDVRLENLVFDGENSSPTDQTGVDINSVNGVVLSNITTKNYTKNGIAVVTQQDASYTKGGNVTFDNVASQNNAWAGIAFYPKSASNYEADLTGITFSGTTTLGDNAQAGIRFGDAGDTAKTTGANGGPVALGTVSFSNNGAVVLNESGNSTATIASDSTVDGRALMAADLADTGVTIASDPNTPDVPKVPNTSTAR